MSTTPETNLREIVKYGHSIVFVPGIAAANLIQEKITEMPVVYLDPRNGEAALRRWLRVTTDYPNGLLLANHSNCTGWRVFADRIVWVGRPIDAEAPEFAQASVRIRGKSCMPIITSLDNL
jgi:hypothetical protein